MNWEERTLMAKAVNEIRDLKKLLSCRAGKLLVKGKPFILNSRSDAMFSVKQKRLIAGKIQEILRETNHPELPGEEISFVLRVRGKENWSWAVIQNNGAVVDPSINPHNEAMDTEGSES